MTSLVHPEEQLAWNTSVILKSLLPCRALLFSILVLANMLMKSGINPFDSQEAKPYKNDVEILAMTNLVTAYQNNDINEFEKILKVFVVEFLHYYRDL